MGAYRCIHGNKGVNRVYKGYNMMVTWGQVASTNPSKSVVGAAPWPMTATGGFAAASEPMLDHPVRGGTYILIRKVKPLLIRNVLLPTQVSYVTDK